MSDNARSSVTSCKMDVGFRVHEPENVKHHSVISGFFQKILENRTVFENS
jgi:hypothetical protein